MAEDIDAKRSFITTPQAAQLAGLSKNMKIGKLIR